MRRGNRPNGSRRDCRQPLDHAVARRYRRHGIVETRVRAIAPAHIEHDRHRAAAALEHDVSNAAAYSRLLTHAVGPKAIDFAILQRFGRGKPEINTLTSR